MDINTFINEVNIRIEDVSTLFVKKLDAELAANIKMAIAKCRFSFDSESDYLQFTKERVTYKSFSFGSRVEFYLDGRPFFAYEETKEEVINGPSVSLKIGRKFIFI